MQRTYGHLHVFLLVRVILAVPLQTPEKQDLESELKIVTSYSRFLEEAERRPKRLHAASLLNVDVKVPRVQSHLRSVEALSDLAHVVPTNSTIASKPSPVNSTQVSSQVQNSSLGSNQLLLANVTQQQHLPAKPSLAHLGKDVGAVRAAVPEGSVGGIAPYQPWTFENLILNRTSIITVFLWAALTSLVGVFYYQEKAHPPRLDPEGVNVSLHDRDRLNRRRWRFGLFECCDAPSLCLFSFLCAPVRWADTMRMIGFLNYFSALGLVIALTLIGFLTFGMGFIVLIGVMVMYRQQLQAKFNIRANASKDLPSFIFCPWCSIAQEARQVEEAYLARHPVVRAECIAHASTSTRLGFGKAF